MLDRDRGIAADELSSVAKDNASPRSTLGRICAALKSLFSFAGVTAISTCLAAIFTGCAFFVSKKQFVSANPPKLIMRQVHLDELAANRPAVIRCLAVNIGNSDARIYSINHTVKVQDSQDAPIGYPHHDPGDKLENPIEIPAGNRKRLEMRDRDITKGELAEIMEGRRFLVAYGYVSYKDEYERIRSIGFWKVYDAKTKRLESISKNEDYDYVE